MGMTLAEIEDGRVYTPKQIGEAIQAPPRRVIQAYRAGELAGIELGPRTIRITGQAVREWLTRKRLPTKLADSGDQAEISQADSGASTSRPKEKSVKDLVLASL
jgi:hypothetical protein